MMTEPVTQTPLAIDRVERARAKHDQVRLRLSGRWLTDVLSEPESTLLVVQLHGRRLRFPAGDEVRDDAPGADAGAGAPFAASFTVPDWAVPEQPGQAVLWVGESVVPVPPPGMAPSPSSSSAPSPPPTDLAGASASPGAMAREPVDPTAGPPPVAASSGRSGPLAELLHKETVSALHAELEQRTAESARLRSALAAARSQLQGDSSARADLETAHGELREELQRLMQVASDQRDEFEQRLADAGVEQERLSGELAGAGEEVTGVREALARAEAELARASEEIVRAREAGEDRLASARSEFDQRLAAVRSEAEAAIEAARSEAQSDAAQARAQAEAELTAARAETEAMLTAARGHSDSRVTAAEAQVARLSEQIAVLQGDERHRFEEAAGLREQLAASQISRDAALGEAEGLRAELDRLGAELAVVREQSGPPGGDLSEARQLLADARALTQRLRGDPSA